MARACFAPLRAPAHLHTTLTNGRRNLQLLEAGCSRCYSLSRCGAACPSGGGSAVSATPAVKDAAYATLSAAQKLDLYVPKGNGPFPVIVYVHGGGFSGGDKAMASLADKFLAAGYAVASVNYRLSGEAKAPAQIQDVKAAVRWVRANASKYNLDSKRFAAFGESAGGSLVALLGTSCGVAALEGAELGNAEQSSCVQAVVDWFGPIDFLTMDAQFAGTSCPKTHNDANSPESVLIGAAIQTKPEAVKQVNAMTYVSARTPAFLIQHGSADCNIPPQQGKVLADAIDAAAGAGKATYTLIPGAGHGTSEFSASDNVKIVLDFLARALQ